MGKDRAGQHVQFHACTSLIPKAITMVISLGMRLDVRMHIQDYVLCNGQQPGSAENNFFDHSKFEAVKSLSGWEAARSDKDQFRTKIKVSEYLSRFRVIIV